MSRMNRLSNCHNRYQGKYQRALCVCSAGLLRSPTAAFVLSQEPYNWNTRAVGVTKDYALIHIDEVHVAWADIILCMGLEQELYISQNFNVDGTPIYNLNIPDDFTYRDPELIEIIKSRIAELQLA